MIFKYRKKRIVYYDWVTVNIMFYNTQIMNTNISVVFLRYFTFIRSPLI